MPRAAAPADISPKEFKDALIDAGFAYLGRSVDRYVDIRHRQIGRYFRALTDARGRILRRETLAALLVARQATVEAQRLLRAEDERRQAIAAKIAPQVMPPCRADLAGTAAIAQLADDYLTRLSSAGYVDFKGLIQMGWTAGQLREHGDSARAVADRRAVPA